MAPASALPPLLAHAKSIVLGVAENTAEQATEDAVQQLKSVVFAITSAGRHNRSLTVEENTAVWELVCLLWNTCVDVANHSPKGNVQEAHVQMRQFASDLLSLVEDESSSDHERICKCQFFHKTGKLWAQFKNYETAEACYSKAMEYSHFLLDICNTADQHQRFKEECAAELFGLLLDRTAVAWQLQQKALASNLLGRARDLASNEDLGCDVCFQLNLVLASVHATHAQQLLATPQADGTLNSGEAIGLLNAANEIIGNLSSDDDDPDTEDKITAARQLSAQVYRLLAWAYLEAGDNPTYAMSCIKALRDLPVEISHQAVISFLALKALCQLGSLDEAETELLSVVSSSAVSVMICLGSIKVMLSAVAAGVGTKSAKKPDFAGVRSAVGLMQERFADQANVPVQLVRLLLAQETVSEAAEQTALEICAAEHTTETVMQEEGMNLKQDLFTLLYSHATNLFQQRTYSSASQFFHAAHLYAEEGNKAKTARIMAVCSIATKSLDRALEYVEIAEQNEPASVFNAFLRLKVHLVQQDSKAAAEQIKAMMSCEDFSHEILRVAAQEALAAEQAAVAKAALLQLFGLVEQDTKAATFQPGDEAVIMSNLVKLALESNNQQPEEHKEQQDATDNGHSELSEIAALFERARTRVVHVGYQQFFGSDSNGRASSLEWLAATAWNAAIAAGEAKKFKNAAVLLAAAAAFYEIHPMPENSTVQYQKMAFLMAASASLEAAKQGGDPDNLAKDSISMAGEMLKRYKKAAQALTDRCQSLGVPLSKTEDKSRMYMLIMEFELAVHKKDAQGQHNVLEQCKHSPGFSAESMLKLAAFSKSSCHSSADITKETLHAALKLLLAKGHAVQYDQVAQTMRTLMELTSSDVDKIKLYEEAKQLLAGLPSNAYPDRELQWLVTSCWNKGAHQAKFQRFEAAVQYMRLALALLEHCHSLSARKQMMVEEHSKVMQRETGINRTEAPSTSSPKERKRRRADEADIATSVPLAHVTDSNAAADLFKPDLPAGQQ